MVQTNFVKFLTLINAYKKNCTLLERKILYHKKKLKKKNVRISINSLKRVKIF